MRDRWQLHGSPSFWFRAHNSSPCATAPVPDLRVLWQERQKPYAAEFYDTRPQLGDWNSASTPAVQAAAARTAAAEPGRRPTSSVRNDSSGVGTCGSGPAAGATRPNCNLKDGDVCARSRWAPAFAVGFALGVVVGLFAARR